MDAGAVPLLAHLLDDEKAQVTAAGALRNLAAQNVANQARDRTMSRRSRSISVPKFLLEHDFIVMLS